MSGLLRLDPRAWRARYGEELDELAAHPAFTPVWLVVGATLQALSLVAWTDGGAGVIAGEPAAV